MKIHVAYDAHGRILTAVSRAATERGPMVHIAPQHGAEIADFDLPKEFEGKHPREFLHLLRVDTKNKRLTKTVKG
jgi:hypothetical protein